jgi:hypothetical protein
MATRQPASSRRKVSAVILDLLYLLSGREASNIRMSEICDVTSWIHPWQCPSGRFAAVRNDIRLFFMVATKHSFTLFHERLGDFLFDVAIEKGVDYGRIELFARLFFEIVHHLQFRPSLSLRTVR